MIDCWKKKSMEIRNDRLLSSQCGHAFWYWFILDVTVLTMDSVEWWIPSNIKFSVLLRDLIGVRQRYQPKGCLKGHKSTYEQFYFTSVIMKIVLVHCLIKLKWNNEGKLIIWVELEQKTVIWESSAARFSDDIYGTPLKWNWWLFNYQSINRLINCYSKSRQTNQFTGWDVYSLSIHRQLKLLEGCVLSSAVFQLVQCFNLICWSWWQKHSTEKSSAVKESHQLVDWNSKKKSGATNEEATFTLHFNSQMDSEMSNNRL